MKITAQDIHNHEFKRSIRGYDMDEVDAFLTQLADELEQLVSENQGLKDSAKTNEGNLTDYRKKNELLQKTLLAAQDVTEKIKSTSQQEMQQATNAANREAEKILARANNEVAAVKAQIDDLKRQRDAFVIQFKALLDTYNKFLSELKKSDFEALSSTGISETDKVTIERTATKETEPEKYEPESEAVVDKGETVIASTEQITETQRDPMKKLTNLDFDDLIREETGGDAEPGAGEVG
ncbi:MAG: DivIVA domain-containing protein [bacterium]|nr:DivIVA domain-containing protein [bacterium]